MKKIKKLSIEALKDLKKELVPLIKKEKPLTLDFSNLEGLDFSGLQFLVALVKDCERKKITLDFVGDLAEDAKKIVIFSGLSNYSCETWDCVLKHLKEV